LLFGGVQDCDGEWADAAVMAAAPAEQCVEQRSLRAVKPLFGLSEESPVGWRRRGHHLPTQTAASERS